VVESVGDRHAVTLPSEDREQIVEVLNRYCRGVDRRNWDMMLSAFHEDALDEHGEVNGTAADLVEWTKKRHGRVLQSMHALTNISVLAADRDRAWTESYCTVHQTMSRGNERPPAFLSIGCRYIDLFERRAEWRIARRHVRYDWVYSLKVERDFLATSPDLPRSDRDGGDIVFALPVEL
jgi:3-phenylpropionate/cinnamic acid dioxygenase small subunit